MTNPKIQIFKLICEDCSKEFEQQNRRLCKDGKKRCTTCRRRRYGKDEKSIIYRKSDKYKKSTRKSHLKINFNMTLEDYNNLLKKQNGVCDICKTSTGSYNSENLCVDHDHSTNKVRGLLCDKCNLAIGKLKDNPKILQNAINYLNKFNQIQEWSDYYKLLCEKISLKSKDPSTKVGAIIVDADKHLVLGTGYNGYPYLYPDEVSNWQWNDNDENSKNSICHAELNSVLNSTVCTKTYPGRIQCWVTHAPCQNCLKYLINAGIKEFYYFQPFKGWEISKRLADACRIVYQEIK